MSIDVFMTHGVYAVVFTMSNVYVKSVIAPHYNANEKYYIPVADLRNRTEL